MIRQLVRASLCAMVLMGVASALPLLNGSFEQPITSSYVYDPIDPTGAWSFFARSGVASTLFFTAPPPNGNQAAFLQQFSDQTSSLSSITQSVSGVSLAPSVLSFFIAQRPGGFAGNPTVVKYGTQNLGTFTPSSTTFTQITINFTPTATSGNLVFQSAATTTGDLDTAIDQVTFSSGVPEPATALLLLPALGLLGFVRQRAGKTSGI